MLTESLLAPATFAIALSIYAPPTLLAQHDVHAPLVAAADRKPAPAFHLLNEKSHRIQLSNYRGKVVLINFWATECGGCVLEIPSFIDIQKTHKDTPFRTVGISVDIPYDGLKDATQAWSKVKPFLASHHVNYEILMGDQSISDTFGLNAYPATFLLDKKGRIAATYIGVVSQQDVEHNIDTLLLEQRPKTAPSSVQNAAN